MSPTLKRPVPYPPAGCKKATACCRPLRSGTRLRFLPSTVQVVPSMPRAGRTRVARRLWPAGHGRVAAGGWQSVHTGDCEENTPPEKKAGVETSFQRTKSGGGEQRSCRSTGRGPDRGFAVRGARASGGPSWGFPKWGSLMRHFSRNFKEQLLRCCSLKLLGKCPKRETPIQGTPIRILPGVALAAASAPAGA